MKTAFEIVAAVQFVLPGLKAEAIRGKEALPA